MSDRIAVLIPCHRRPEYTKKCLDSIEQAQGYENCVFYLVDDGSDDQTEDILVSAKIPSVITIRKPSIGLRATIIDFFDFVKSERFDFISKIDNDCTVPQNWLDDLVSIIKTGEVDIISPNVTPSNAAYVYGSPTEPSCPFMPSGTVGGLWTMRADMISEIFFENLPLYGIKGAIQLLNQIIVENNARVAWAKNVTVQDIGHWSGRHPDHIKSKDHFDYSNEVGRTVTWFA